MIVNCDEFPVAVFLVKDGLEALGKEGLRIFKREQDTD
jgi:hypothetical protein